MSSVAPPSVFCLLLCRTCYNPKIMRPQVKKVLSVFFLFCPLAVSAQSPRESPVHWKAKPLATPVRAGQAFEIQVEAAIEGDWHLYSTTQRPPPNRTRFTLLSGEPFQMHGDVRQSAPKTEFDSNIGIQNETFTVRRISYGEGVERVFPLHSPRIAKVEVEQQGRVRRARLNYLRGRKGKEATAVRE